MRESHKIDVGKSNQQNRTEPTGQARAGCPTAHVYFLAYRAGPITSWPGPGRLVGLRSASRHEVTVQAPEQSDQVPALRSHRLPRGATSFS
jgi:hypothetical protein